jgi:hypothetical protein
MDQDGGDRMSLPPVLIVHIAAGSIGILSGAAALASRKGAAAHRGFGVIFVLAMTATAAMAVYLALFVPPVGRVSIPSHASVAIATLSFYLAGTAWLTVRRPAGRSGLLERLALLFVAGDAAALVYFGLHAGGIGAGKYDPPQPYFVFATFAAFCAALDLKVLIAGGIAGRPRIARHLWRMCFALFFATAFFFIGQQKVMPKAWHGSPVLLVLGLAPLGFLLFWMVRVRWTRWYGDGTVSKI